MSAFPVFTSVLVVEVVEEGFNCHSPICVFYGTSDARRKEQRTHNGKFAHREKHE